MSSAWSCFRNSWHMFLSVIGNLCEERSCIDQSHCGHGLHMKQKYSPPPHCQQKYQNGYISISVSVQRMDFHKILGVSVTCWDIPVLVKIRWHGQFTRTLACLFAGILNLTLEVYISELNIIQTNVYRKLKITFCVQYMFLPKFFLRILKEFKYFALQTFCNLLSLLEFIPVLCVLILSPLLTNSIFMYELRY